MRQNVNLDYFRRQMWKVRMKTLKRPGTKPARYTSLALSLIDVQHHHLTSGSTRMHAELSTIAPCSHGVLGLYYILHVFLLFSVDE